MDSQTSSQTTESGSSQEDCEVLQDLDDQPYLYEPEYDCQELELMVVEVAKTEKTRLGNTTWCTCGRCAIMEAEVSCKCCQETVPVKGVMKEYNVSCIVDHPGFDAICTNPHVLKVAYKRFKKSQATVNGSTPNELFRYTAYRCFVEWCWGRVGKDTRVVIPSCAIGAIRHSFSSVSGVYKGFKLPCLR